MARRAPAVGFDFDHTLGVDNKLERIAFLRLLERVIASGGNSRGRLVDEIEAIDALLVLQRSGAFSVDEAVRRFVAERAPAVAAEPFIGAYKNMALASVEELVVPIPGVYAMLDALRSRGIAHAILSNGWSPLQDRKAARIGFDGPVLVSDRIGVQKPAPAAFAALCAALDSRPEQTYYVGDNPAADMAGAIQAGLRAVWFDAESTPYPKDIPPPYATVHRLEDLLQII